MKTQAIIPTAGTGKRLKAKMSKPFVELCGKPLCVYALAAFDQSPVIDSIIVVGQEDELAEFKNIISQYGVGKVTSIVAGGKTRRESVSNGIAALDHDTDIVVVHDGARPLISLDLIKNAVQQCQQGDAAVCAIPVKSTIKKVNSTNMTVDKTLDRKQLWEIQTPQVFQKEVLVQAHQTNTDKSPTDDAVMIEQLGVKVKVIHGDYKNIKVTTQEDLLVAEAFLKTEKCAVKEP